MKDRKIIMTIFALLILVFILVQNTLGCSMFKLTMYGKTMVGNNEDYWNPNSRIWFETISFCSSVMDTMHQERNWGAGTMYTTIYDLKDGMIFLYFFRDYTHVVKFNLTQELKKMDYSLVIPDLFPENKKGQDFLNNYNVINSSLDLYKSEDILSDSIRYKNVTSILFKKDIKLIGIFANKINEIGNSWIEKNNYGAAISVFRINVIISQDSWITYSILADAYLKNKQEDLALINYEKSIELNPDYSEGRNHIEQLRRVLKTQTNANNR